MWVPYNLLPPLKAESPRPVIAASEAAKNERDFVVGFLLRNPISKVWECDILVTAGVGQEDVTIAGRSGKLHASGNPSRKLEEIIYTLPATAAASVLSDCYAHVVKLLERHVLQYGRGIEIIGWRVADTEHGARWRCVPFLPSALTAEAAFKVVPPDFNEVLRLYREARCTASARWRLICAGAIIDAAVAGRQPFDATENVETKNNLGIPLVTGDMLRRSNAIIAHPNLKGAGVAAVHDLIEPRRQAFLSALVRVGEAEIEADASLEAESELAALANLADLVARDLILACMRARGAYRPAIAEPEAEVELLELAGLS